MVSRARQLWRRLAQIVSAGVTALRQRGRRGALAGLLVAAITAMLVAGLIRVRVDTSAESFLPANDPTLAAVQQKATDFGGDPVIVVLRYAQPRQFVNDTDQIRALLGLEGRLARLPDVATVYGPATVLNQVAGSIQRFLAGIGVMRNEARQRGEDAARAAGKPPAEVTADGQDAVNEINLRYAPLLLRGQPAGLPTLHNPRFAQTVLFGPDGLPKPEWRFIVPGTDTVAILVRPRQDMDQEATQRLVEEIRATVSQAKVQPVSSTVSGVPAITAALGDEVRREAPVIGALVALAVLLRYLWVPAPGTRWQRLRPLLTSLLGSAVTLALFGWLDYPLSFGAVVLLPLLLGIGSSFPLYLAAVPNRRRVLVMSVASAAAFLALGLSPLPFVRDLGLALGIGILCTIGVAQLLSRFWPTPAMAETDDPGPRDPGGARPPTRRSIAVRVVAAVAAVVVAALGWVALPRLSVSANPVDMARGLPALADARTVESTLGASGEIAVRLSGPDVLSPEGLRWSTDASAVLRDRFRDQLPEVVGVSGLFSFLGPDPTPGQVRTALEAMPSYLSSAVVRPDRGVSLLIHGLKLQDLGTQERLLADVNAALPAVPRGYTADVVGLPVAAVRGYQVLLEDRYLANLAGIGVAGLVLVIGLRRRWDAARAVTAAVLATGWGLGLIWLLGLGLSPLTMALGSLVGVTGCEFVVLLSESRRRAQSWLWRSVAVACATSVLGYLALAASRLWLVREFGLVLGVAVGLSYLAAKLVVWSAPPRGSKAPHAMVPESRAAGAVEATA